MLFPCVNKFSVLARLRNAKSNKFTNKAFPRRFKSLNSAILGGATDINYRMKSVRVCVTAGCTETGKEVAFLLAQNPLIYGLNLHGGPKTSEIAEDLNQLDTRCIVKGYQWEPGLMKAIMGSDIVLVLGLNQDNDTNCTDEDLFHQEGLRVAKIARICAFHAPKTYFVVCVHPVSMLLPMCVEIFKASPMYNPGRIIGSCALTQLRLNKILAEILELNPSSVHVPITGGPEISNVIPMFNRATPYPLTEHESAILTRRLYGIDYDMDKILIKRAKFVHITKYSHAVAINRLTTVIAESLCGDAHAISNIFMRTNVLGNVCRYLTSAVKFAPGGVTRNYGIPQLNKSELDFLDKCLLELEKRENFALEAYSKMVFPKDPANYFNVPCSEYHQENRM